MARLNLAWQANPAPLSDQGRQDMAQALAYFFLPAAGLTATGAAFLAGALALVFWTAFLLVALGDLSPIVLVFLIVFTGFRNISFPGDRGNMHLFGGRCLLPDENIFQPAGFLTSRDRAARLEKNRRTALRAAARRLFSSMVY